MYVVVTLPSGILFPDLKRSVVSSTRADRLDCEATSMWKTLRKSQNVNLDSQTVTMKEKLVSFSKVTAKNKLDFGILKVEQTPETLVMK